MRKVPSVKTVGAVSALGACVAAAFVLLPFWNRSVSVFNLDAEIEVGMTEDEVVVLIGGLGADFPDERRVVWFSSGVGEPNFGSYSKVWINDNGSALIVSFNAEGRVVSVRGGAVTPPETWFETILNACWVPFR